MTALSCQMVYEEFRGVVDRAASGKVIQITRYNRLAATVRAAEDGDHQGWERVAYTPASKSIGRIIDRAREDRTPVVITTHSGTDLVVVERADS